MAGLPAGLIEQLAAKSFNPQQPGATFAPSKEQSPVKAVGVPRSVRKRKKKK
jgi:hypothetical protein